MSHVKPFFQEPSPAAAARLQTRRDLQSFLRSMHGSGKNRVSAELPQLDALA